MKIMTKRRAVYATGMIVVMTAAISLTGCAEGRAFPNVITVQNADSTMSKVTVIGNEEVKVVPDMAEIRYSIHTKADSAESCQTQNSQDLAKAIEALKAMGVEETSIQTSAYGMNPVYDWNSPDKEITGYEMTTRLTVSNIPIDNAGKILSESVAAGVNGIDSVDYFSSQYDEKYQEALKGAMDMAKAKAEALAAASEKSLIGVIRVEEYGYNPSVRNSTYGPGATEKAVAFAADMAVMPGEVTVEAQVTVEYEIN